MTTSRHTRSVLVTYLERLTRAARRAFPNRDHGETSAQLVIGGFPITFDVPNAPEARAGLRALLEVAVRGGAEMCSIVEEAWMAGGDLDIMARIEAWRKSGRSLEEFPGRQEVLLIEAASPAGHLRREFLIVRQGETVRLKPSPRVPGITAGFDPLLVGLPWPGPTRRSRLRVVQSQRR
jgi:hypothetical protein